MQYVVPAITAALLGVATPLSASECKQTGELTGRVSTANLSETMQYGTTEIEITNQGRPVFSEKGVIIGQVVGTHEGLPVLNHTMFFSNGVRIETEGDVVEQLDPTGKLEGGVPCEFYAVERITKAWGNKQLRRLSNDQHNIEATGMVSYCSDNNRNALELHGTVCFE